MRSELLGEKKFFCHAQGPLRGPGSEDAPRGHKGVRLTPQILKKTKKSPILPEFRGAG